MFYIWLDVEIIWDEESHVFCVYKYTFNYDIDSRSNKLKFFNYGYRFTHATNKLFTFYELNKTIFSITYSYDCNVYYVGFARYSSLIIRVFKKLPYFSVKQQI